MRNYRPLLIQDIGIRVQGVTVHRLRLNRHTPEAQWTSHSHDHAQLLIYLSGRGKQEVDGQNYAARPGTVIYIKEGKKHAFEKKNFRQPLCLVLDIDLEQSPWLCHVCTHMANADLAKVRGGMEKLFQLQAVEKREMSLIVGAIVLETLHVTLRTVGWLRAVNRYGDDRQLGVTRMVERAIERYEGQDVSLDKLAQRVGYQQDYLNRLVKRECGLTLGQLRSRYRVRKAQALLQQPNIPIHEIAEKVGILDHNYFSRWFRQQTGMSPREWKKTLRPIDPL